MKKVILIIVLCIATLASSAQLRKLSNDQAMIEKAIMPAMTSVTRAYILQDKASGQTFKTDGKDYFNKVTSRAYKIAGGLVVTKAAITPWEDDEEFKEYSDGYNGIATDLQEGDAGKPIMFDTSNVICLSEQGGLYYIALDSTADGLHFEKVDGDVEGWVVLLMQNEDSTYSTVSFRKKLSVKSKISHYELERPLGKMVIVGGIYIKPVYPTIGVVNFKLCGFVVDETDKLGIIIPSLKKGMFTPSKATPQKSSGRKGASLVPVENKPGKEVDGGQKTEAKKVKK